MGTMSTLIVCMASVGLNPPQKATVDTVDLIEINHFYDEQGRLVFDQIIFYDWCPEESRYQVCDWRLLKHRSQVPLPNWRDGNYVAVWRDFKDRDILRKVQAKMTRETWTQYDPELVEREFLPQEQRRELRKVARFQREEQQRSRAAASPSPPPAQPRNSAHGR